MKTQQLVDDYKRVVTRYIKAFCHKHDLDKDYGDWICGDIGGIYENADCYFSFDDIRFDIDHNLPENMIFDWYYATIDYLTAYDKGTKINLRSWNMGIRYAKVPSKFKQMIKPLYAIPEFFRWHFYGKRELRKRMKQLFEVGVN